MPPDPLNTRLPPLSVVVAIVGDESAITESTPAVFSAFVFHASPPESCGKTSDENEPE